jgi:hypothetical protein
MPAFFERVAPVLHDFFTVLPYPYRVRRPTLEKAKVRREPLVAMIVYQLRCAKRHEFEAWFRDSAAFDAQSRRGAVECPRCGDTQIEKAPRAPRPARAPSLAR